MYSEYITVLCMGVLPINTISEGVNSLGNICDQIKAFVPPPFPHQSGICTEACRVDKDTVGS